jgi:hypothetical protein
MDAKNKCYRDTMAVSAMLNYQLKHKFPLYAEFDDSGNDYGAVVCYPEGKENSEIDWGAMRLKVRDYIFSMTWLFEEYESVEVTDSESELEGEIFHTIVVQFNN